MFKSKKFEEEKEEAVKTKKVKKPFYKRKWFIGIVILIVLSMIFGETDTEETSPSENINAETQVEEETVEEPVEEKPQEEVKPTNVVEEPVEEVETVEEAEPVEEIVTPDIFEPSEFNTITYEELARNPETHAYTAIQLEGKVIQVIEGDTFAQYRLAVNDDYDTVVFIEVDKSLTNNNRIIENDYIRIYGTSIGLVTYEATIGGQISVPGIIVENFEFIN